MQPGVVEKVDGFIGRRDAKAWKASDNYVADVSNDREAYQLEPVATVTDDLGNITFYKDYRDYVNSCKIRNADVVDHSKLSSQEYYAWDPHISWDKFVNFREYFWLLQDLRVYQYTDRQEKYKVLSMLQNKTTQTMIAIYFQMK